MSLHKFILFKKQTLNAGSYDFVSLYDGSSTQAPLIGTVIPLLMKIALFN